MRIKLTLTLTLILTTVLSMCVFTACGNSIGKDEVTLILKTPMLPIDAPFDNDIKTAADFLQKAGEDFASTYEDANVTINVYSYENTDEVAAIDDCFESDEAVDVLYNDYFTMETHVHSGYVVPLDDVITDDIRNDIDKNFWDQSMINGKTYMMPYLYRQNVLAYNKELFRRADLGKYVTHEDKVQTWTMDEWEEILRKLRASMPANSYPMMLYAKNNQGDTHILSYIRSQGSTIFDDNNRFDLDDEKGVAGLKWIKDCVDKGYMPDNAVYLEILDNFDLFDNNQLAIYMANLGNMNTFRCDYGLVNFPTVNGGCNTNFLTGFEVYDNGDPQKLKAAKAFVKYIYESDYLDYSACNIPCSNKTFEKYSEDLKHVQKFIDNADKGYNFTGGNPNWVGVRSVFYTHIQDLISGDLSPEMVAEEIDYDCNEKIDEGYIKSILHE